MRFIIFRHLSDKKYKEPSVDTSLWAPGDEGWFRVCGPEMKYFTKHALDSVTAFEEVTRHCILCHLLEKNDIIYIQKQFYLFNGEFEKLDISDKRVTAILNTFL